MIPCLPPRPTPEEVHPEAADELATALVRAGGCCEQVAEHARGRAVPAGWDGVAAHAYRDALARIAPRLDGLARGLRTVARAGAGYAGELSATKAAREQLDRGWLALQQRHGALSARSRQAVVAAAAPAGAALAAGMVAELAAESRSLAADIADWQTSVRRNDQRRRAADEAMTDALHAARRQVREPAIGEPDAGVFPVGRTARSSAAEPAASGKVSPVPSGSPEERARWWRALSGADQAALLAARPALLGRMRGLPARVRDLANRELLRRDLARFRAADRDSLSRRERDRLHKLRAVQRALQRSDGRRDPVTGEPLAVQLWVYDPDAFDGDGRVAISIGDLDTASHVAVQVPGFGNDLDSADELTHRMRVVHEATRHADPGTTSAVTAWIGYDAPDNYPTRDRVGGWDGAGVVREDLARRGGTLLARDLAGLVAPRESDPHLTVIGHSYGSTTVGLAATGPGLPDADDLVLLGSPGAGSAAGHAADLGVGDDHVWVARNSRDWIARLGDHGALGGSSLGGAGLGADPAGDGFGAQRFAAEDHDRRPWPSTDQHRSYFERDTESLANLGRVVVGRSDEVQRVAPVTDPWHGWPRDPEWRRPVRPVGETLTSH